MITAFFNGLIGIGLVGFLGTQYLHFNMMEMISSVLASNFAGLVALLVTLQAEKIHGIREKWLNRSLKTWSLLLTLYLGILLAFVPALRDLRTLSILFFPLILSDGFAILAFGPIQDKIVARQQKKAALQAKAALKAKPSTQATPGQKSKNDFPCFPTDSAML